MSGAPDGPRGGNVVELAARPATAANDLPIVKIDARQIAAPAEDDDVDLSDATNRAHAICGALSTLSLFEVSAKSFWALFGSESLKPETERWLDAAIEKLQKLKIGA